MARALRVIRALDLRPPDPSDFWDEWEWID